MTTPFYKNPYVLGAIIVIAAILVYGYNKGLFSGNTNTTETQEVFTRTGSPVNPVYGAKAYQPECLVPYPKSSKYYGYYYCNNACNSATFYRTQPVYYNVPITTYNPPPRPIAVIG